MKSILLLALVAIIPAAHGEYTLAQTLTAGAQAETGSQFGATLASDGEWLFVGQSEILTGGAVHVFRRTGETWNRTQILSIPVSVDFPENSKFGAGIAIEGNTAIIGATWAASDGFGRAFVYNFDGSSWVRAETLIPSEDGKENSIFGLTIVISGDSALISNHQVTYNERDLNGFVDVFHRSSGTWNREPNGISSGLGGAQFFGQYLALRDDYAFIAAPIGTAPEDIGLYPFVKSGTNITDLGPTPVGRDPLRPEPTFEDPVTSQRIRGIQILDGSNAVSGFTRANDSSVVLSAGIAPLTRDGNLWSYGAFVSISGFLGIDGFALAGNRLVVGSSNERQAALLTSSGGVWIETQRLSSTRSAADSFGAAAAIAGDWIAIGAPGANSQGVVEIFSVSSGGSSRPILAAKGKTKFKMTRRKVVIRGSATDATRVEYKAGKGGFKKAKGSPANWKIPVRLTQKRTVVKVSATGPGGTSKILKFKIKRK